MKSLLLLAVSVLSISQAFGGVSTQFSCNSAIGPKLKYTFYLNAKADGYSYSLCEEKGPCTQSFMTTEHPYPATGVALNNKTFNYYKLKQSTQDTIKAKSYYATDKYQVSDFWAIQWGNMIVDSDILQSKTGYIIRLNGTETQISEYTMKNAIMLCTPVATN